MLTDKASLLKLAVRQLAGIDNSLNQSVAAINAGKAHRTIEISYIDLAGKHS